jgi:alpha-ketoglutarate-dependent taurine dioxygenase
MKMAGTGVTFPSTPGDRRFLETSVITVKRHSDTRWSSKAAAVNAISRQLEKVIAALEQLYDTLTEKLDTREDAALILNGIENFEFVALLFFLSLLIGFRNVFRLKKQLFSKH